LQGAIVEPFNGHAGAGVNQTCFAIL
jgi:hypothetical protein